MSNENWFVSWFDTPWYHLLYNNRDQNEADNFIKLIFKDIHLEKGANVLDIACGKGRHALTISKLGFQTDAFDLSEQSIIVAKKLEYEKLHFYVHDMRIPFKKSTYDAVFNLFSSFGYFNLEEENKSSLFSMFENLKPGGIFVFDYLNPEFVVKNLKPKEIVNREEVQFHITRKIENGTVIKIISFIVNGELKEYEERVKLFNYSVLRKWFKEGNLEVIKEYGSYELQPFSSVNSHRIILVAKKREL